MSKLVVDSVNLQLYGAFDAYHAERLAKAPSAVAALPSDVVCVQEAWGPDTRAAILDAASSAFPYDAVFDFDLDTVPNDPTDQNGVVPAPHTTPPCAAPNAAFDQFIECVQSQCVEPKGDASGRPVNDLSACLTRNCVAQTLPLLTGSSLAQDKACYSCGFVQLESFASPDQTRAACTQDPRARFAWNGNTGTFLLSRYPVKSSEAWVLPFTEFRVIVARAEVTLPAGESVDVYCTSLNEPQEGG